MFVHHLELLEGSTAEELGLFPSLSHRVFSGDGSKFNLRNLAFSKAQNDGQYPE
jgi:hypothetical protein